MNTYRIYWQNGKEETGRGNNLAHAISLLGYKRLPQIEDWDEISSEIDERAIQDQVQQIYENA